MRDNTALMLALVGENILIVACATFLAYEWDTAWPLLLLLMCNSLRLPK